MSIENHNERIQQLSLRLELLSSRQEQFSKEINALRKQIEVLKASKWTAIANESQEKEKPVVAQSEKTSEATMPKETIPPTPKNQWAEMAKETFTNTRNDIVEETEKLSNLEKFIGENLLNKIGIIITIIGVSIGVKYSIDNNLITPLMRIISGYICGIALLGFGIKLKKKYENYSAVLVSGAIAIMYFITYAAHSFYGLIPQVPAFLMMVLFTVFGVATAIHYNRQVIAHIGLVGAYAVPFLLSNDSGNALILFSYMTIINIGILVIAYKKYWKLLYGSAFGLSWLIYFSWLVAEYSTEQHFGIALTFLAVFFLIFYAMLLAYKVLKKEVYTNVDIVLLLLNTFFFYAMGYFILHHHAIGGKFLGIFTLINAMLHSIVCGILYRRKDIDTNLLYLIIGLVITFITIAIPVELDGNWVTMLWVLEAAILFWIGRTQHKAIYEKLAYPLMVLAFLSIIHDWTTLYPTINSYYEEKQTFMPLVNMNFVNSIFFIVGFGFITKLFFNTKYTSPMKLSKSVVEMLSFVLPAILILGVYFAFRLEIQNYWNQLYLNSENIYDSGLDLGRNYSYLKYKVIWILNYTLFFLAILIYANIKKIKNQVLGYVNLGLNVGAILVFLVQGLFILADLRNMYITEVFSIGIGTIVLRYISYLFVALLLYMSYTYILKRTVKKELKIIFDCVLHFTALCLLSSELLHWLDMASSIDSDKLGLSILWGIYALFVIVLGIWKRKRYLRIAAIVLFGITLVKLFFYDIAHLPTLSKTIVFVSLGVLLLIISFLYNKYTSKIFEE